ncbi:hypothetical protein FNO01nite_30910 [Flavobacterium noncentrifugens]|nr:hypothetical protein FNO01nite_30910 [Flavobacterium noncentrifugens]
MILLTIFALSCRVCAQDIFKSVAIDTLLADDFSIRSIVVDQNKIWYAADKGKYGWIDIDTGIDEQNQIDYKDLKPEFRSIAQTNENIFMLSIGDPGLLYKIHKSDKKIELVYQESHDGKVFYDSMKFWNDKEGIAVGDPVENVFSIITTHDGGQTWKKEKAVNLPELSPGEAVFAASNTNIVIVKNETWIVSGGTKARVFYSSDKGKHWTFYATPIIQGSAMSGIFTADFYDDKTGFIAGGNYDDLNNNYKNKAITSDGGKTWKLTADGQGFGYASCIQYVPKSKATQIVSVGASGLQYSSYSGKNWIKFSDENQLYTLYFVNKNTAIAAGKNKIVKLNFKF